MGRAFSPRLVRCNKPGALPRLEWHALLVLNSEGEQICRVSFFSGGADDECLRRAVAFYDEDLVAEPILAGEHRGTQHPLLLPGRRATIYPKVM